MSASRDQKLDGQEIEFALLLRSIWTLAVRTTRLMEHLPQLPNQHVEILQRLESAGGMTPAELASAMRLSRPAISEVTRKLFDDGLIARIPSRTDGRSVVLVATDQARAVMTSFQHGMSHAVTLGLQRLPARDRQRLLSDLTPMMRLRDHLEVIEQAAVDAEEESA